MQCRFISHPEFWPEAALHKKALTFPASVPALASLVDRKLPHVLTSSFLAREDYQSIWQRSFLDVWRLIERSVQAETTERPNLVLLHGYSLFLLLCESRALWTVLDRAFE